MSNYVALILSLATPRWRLRLDVGAKSTSYNARAKRPRGRVLLFDLEAQVYMYAAPARQPKYRLESRDHIETGSRRGRETRIGDDREGSRSL